MQLVAVLFFVIHALGAAAPAPAHAADGGDAPLGPDPSVPGMAVPIGPTVGEPFVGAPFGLRVRSVVDARELPAYATARDLVFDAKAAEKIGSIPRIEPSLEDFVRGAFEQRFPAEGAYEVIEVDIEIRRFAFRAPGFLSGHSKLDVEMVVRTDALESLPECQVGDAGDVGVSVDTGRPSAKSVRRALVRCLANVTERYSRHLTSAWRRDRPDAPRANVDLTDPVRPGLGRMAWKGLSTGVLAVAALPLFTFPGDAEPHEAHTIAAGVFAAGAMAGVMKGNNHRGRGGLVILATAAAYTVNVVAFDLESDVKRAGPFWASTTLSTFATAFLVESLTSSDADVFLREASVSVAWVDGPGVAVRGGF